MQIERLYTDLSYLKQQAVKGGVFFQSWTSGSFTPAQTEEFARGVAYDAAYIYSKRNPLPKNITQVLKEIERQAPKPDLLPIIFTLGWMVGKAHERWRHADPQSKSLLQAARRTRARVMMK